MIHTIENEKIAVSIDSKGAEFSSIRLKSDGTEYLWQGDERYWVGRAFNLFPICGRLTGGRYTYRNQSYAMEIHGFLRESELEAIEKTGTSVTFRLTENEATLAQYPFRFDIRITYSLDGASVKTTYAVRNTDDGQELIFTLGGHPGFNVPLESGESFEDSYLEFAAPAPARKMVFSDTCFFTGEEEPFPLDRGTVIPLRHDLFDNDAIFLKDMCRDVSLRSKKSGRYVRVRFDGMPYLGLWHAPRTDAPYICIEPWCSVPSDDGIVDDMETKRNMIRLSPGHTYENEFTIEIG